MPGVERLRHEEVRKALRLLGEHDTPSTGADAQRRLRAVLRASGTVRAVVQTGPPGARAAFARLIQAGECTVSELLGRGWWGHGTLPPPLDWLQVRALVVVDDSGAVWITDEARDGYLEMSLASPAPAPAPVDDGLRVEAVRAAVVATSTALLDRAVGVRSARLRAVAPTVALSDRTPEAVAAVLRGAGLPLDDDLAVAAQPAAPALPGTAEDAVGPWAIRALLDRALSERRQVRLEYYASSRGGAVTDRVVDPWSFGDDLLRGYCHLRQGERTFAVDRIGHARLLPSALEHAPRESAQDR